jgi:hypothetical protein
LGELPTILPQYIIKDSYTWSMYGRNYIQWDDNCRDMEFIQDTLNQSENLGKINKAQIGLLVVSIIYFIFISIIFTSMMLITLMGGRLPCTRGRINLIIYVGNERDQSNFVFKAEIAFKIIF